MEKIILHTYPFNYERLMINDFIRNKEITWPHIENAGLAEHILPLLEDYTVLEYVTSEIVDFENGNSYRVYTPTQKFWDEYAFNKEQNRMKLEEGGGKTTGDA